MFTVDIGILFVTDQCVAVFEPKGDSSSSSALLFYRGSTPFLGRWIAYVLDKRWIRFLMCMLAYCL